MIKKVFFGFDIETLWVDIPKEKKMINEANRHVTVVFLGNLDIGEIDFNDLPKADFEIGPVGFFNKCLFLPPRHPRLVAYQIDFFEKDTLIKSFQKKLFEFFIKKNIVIKPNNFLPHVTICRNDFNKKVWEESFKFLPLFIKSLNFYESFKNSEYKTLWQKDFIKPFEEIEHTADIAFIIRGKNYTDLLYNSFIALAFKSLDLLLYIKELNKVESIDDVVIKLNEIITKAEIDGFYIPFKAVSFHAYIEKKDDILNWEMIVDV
jgi:RNA 2',3'-cyclic 3'-phosphodiesterase